MYATVATSTMMTDSAASISPFDSVLAVAGMAAEEGDCAADGAASRVPLGIWATEIPVPDAGAYTGVAVEEDCATGTRVDDESRFRRCRSVARSSAL